MAPSDEHKVNPLLGSWEKSALVIHGVVIFNAGGFRRFFGKVEGLTTDSVVVIAGESGVKINLKDARVSDAPDGNMLDIIESGEDHYLLYILRAPEPVA